MTRNNPSGNVELGDRVLALWLGQEGYTFITMDDKTKNPNIFKPIPYEDIEGVWTYVYFSYSGKLNQAVGFIKYGDGEVKKVDFQVTIAQPTFLRFILGGNDVI